MKKVLPLVSFVLVAMLCFSSCSADENEARVLSGEWHGDWSMWYEDEFGRTWTSNDTYIRFDRGRSTSGEGTQVDYYRRGPYEYLVYRFYWSVSDGVIYLTYPHDPEMDVAIYDYHLSNRVFDGYFGSSRASFTMDKISSFEYWTPAVVVSSWFGYTSYTYYSNGYDGAAGSKSYNGGNLPKIVRRGGHAPLAAAQAD